ADRPPGLGPVASWRFLVRFEFRVSMASNRPPGLGSQDWRLWTLTRPRPLCVSMASNRPPGIGSHVGDGHSGSDCHVSMASNRPPGVGSLGPFLHAPPRRSVSMASNRPPGVGSHHFTDARQRWHTYSFNGL